MSGRNSMTDSPVGPPPVRPSRRPRPPSSPLPAPPAAPSASAPGGTLPPPPEGLSRRSSQTYLCSRSWCASSPKDPVIASSPAYHDHPPQRLLLNLSDTTAKSSSSRPAEVSQGQNFPRPTQAEF